MRAGPNLTGPSRAEQYLNSLEPGPKILNHMQ